MCRGRRGGDDEEPGGDAAFDGDNGEASVGYGETDVDEGDPRKSVRVNSRCVEPPERERCGRLRESDDDSPSNRRSQPWASDCAIAATLYEASGTTLKLNIIPLS